MIDVSLVSSKFMITEKGRPAGMLGVFSLHDVDMAEQMFYSKNTFKTYL